MYALFEVVISSHVAGWISCVPKRTANRIEAEVVVANTTSRWLRPHPLTLFSRPPSRGLGLPSFILSRVFFLYLFLHSPIFLSLFPVSFSKLYSISHPSSLLLYSYSLLGPRWLIVYATRVLLSSSPQTNTRFCRHLSIY